MNGLLVFIEMKQKKKKKKLRKKNYPCFELKGK